MARMIAVARINGKCRKSGLILRKGDGYEIDSGQFDPKVFALPGEKIDTEEQVPTGDAPERTAKEDGK